MRPKIVVVGSSNIDMVMQVNKLPQPGETVGGGKYLQAFGGKGGNQAVAAARLGGDVNFISCLGNDLLGEALSKHYHSEGIDTRYLVYSTTYPTGTALILVGKNAENSIAVAPGANAELLPNRIQTSLNAFENADIIMMQAEIPLETIRYVAHYAHNKGIKVMFNPAPACNIENELMALIDILVLNESEAELISELTFEQDGVEKVAQTLIDRGAKQVVITLGRHGAYFQTSKESHFIPSFKVTAIDSTAAGDTFCGALATVCAFDHLDSLAIRFANAAAALAVTKMGAQPSIPTLAEVEKLIESES